MPTRSATPPPPGGSSEHADVVVVGSGFGGAVAAHRFAAAGRSVVVLERGRAFGPGDFPRMPGDVAENFWSPDDGLFGMFETWSFRGLEGLVSSGLGGGSLIYANVLLRKDPEWFVQDSPLPGGGYETWPIGREDLEPHYDNVEKMLGAASYPYEDTVKTDEFERAAREAGHEPIRPPLAVTFRDRAGTLGPYLPIHDPGYGNLHGRPRYTCSLCGECDLGCNFGAKNSLDHTYLSAAQHAGAQIRTLTEAKGVRPVDGGGWEVRYRTHRPGGRPADGVLRADRVVLAAGTFGTTDLLLRNRASLPGLSPALGHRFTGNGDLLGFLLRAKERLETGELRARPLGSGRGTVITSAVRVGDALDGDGSTGRGFYLEDAGYPGFLNWVLEIGQMRSVLSRGTRAALALVANRLKLRPDSNISDDISRAFGGAELSRSSLALLAMGRDVPDGRMFLEDGKLQVDWTSTTSMPYFERIRDTMRAIGEKLDAEFSDNPLWWAKRTITVHPLGGAPMGRNHFEGVVDQWGEVFEHPGLYVLDGAAMPGAVGPNPSLTIAAFADRAAEHAVEQAPARRRRAKGTTKTGTTSSRTTSSGTTKETTVTPPPPPVPGGTSVSFTEQMKGHLALGPEADPSEAYQDARARGERAMFELTITAPDIDAFVAAEAHEGVATGYLDADVLGGRLPVERGWFNLFVRGTDPSDRLMKYRLWLTTAGGQPVTFVGYKDVHDDPGFDLWDDTTTLFVQLLDGHVPPAPLDDPGHLPAGGPGLLGAGVLKIHPLDFAKQLTTFAAEGPDGPAAIARFGGLFLGKLWDTYASLAHGEEKR